MAAFALFANQDPIRNITLLIAPPEIDAKLGFPRVPDCVIGRVGELNSAVPPDWNGASTLFNVNPFGKWSVKLISDSADKPDTIRDIVLDLKIVTQIGE